MFDHGQAVMMEFIASDDTMRRKRDRKNKFDKDGGGRAAMRKS
jgi:hypothetical protein